MPQVTKILVPIDFSCESGQALRDAAALARKTWAQLIALHVIDENLERDSCRPRSCRSTVCRFPQMVRQRFHLTF